MNIYTLSLIILLTAIILGYRRPAYSLPILVSLNLLIPYIIKFNVGINLNIFNLSVLVMMLLSMRLIHSSKPIDIYIKRYLKGYFLYVCIYSLIISLGTFTLGEYIQNMMLFFFEFIGMAYCLSYIKFDEKSIRYFNIAIISCSIIIIIYGFFNYITKVNPYIMYLNILAGIDDDMAERFMAEQRGFLDGRVSSTFIHPLQLGQSSLLLFCYILYEMKGKLNVILYLSVLGGLILMCVLCGSRSAVFPLLVPICFYLRNVKIRRKFLYALFAISVVSCVFVSMPPKTQKTLKAMVFVWDEKASSDADIHGSSVSGRTNQYIAALNIVKDNILFGKGRGYIAKHGSDNPEMLGYESFVLRELVEGGVCGLLIYLLFYFLIYQALLRCAVTPLERARIHSICLSFFISILLTGVSYSFFSLYMTFCIVMYNIMNERNKLIKYTK